MEISKTKASLFASLRSKKLRQKHGMFLAEGEKCVADTLDAFELVNLIASKNWIDINKEAFKSYADRILTAPEQTLKKISSLSTPPDVIAVFRIPETTLIPDISEKLVLLLDGIQDPGNLGTIIRTADWFGVNIIFASQDTVDVYNPKTVQSTMGSLKRVNICYTDLKTLIKKYPEMPVYGTLLNGKNMFNSNLGNFGLIVMGNEGNGISDDVRELINHPLLIPPHNQKSHGESLNVAIATAITLAEFRNPR